MSAIVLPCRARSAFPRSSSAADAANGRRERSIVAATSPPWSPGAERWPGSVRQARVSAAGATLRFANGPRATNATRASSTYTGAGTSTPAMTTSSNHRPAGRWRELPSTLPNKRPASHPMGNPHRLIRTVVGRAWPTTLVTSSLLNFLLRNAQIRSAIRAPPFGQSGQRRAVDPTPAAATAFRVEWIAGARGTALLPRCSARA